MKIIYIAELIGKVGVFLVKELLPQLRKQYRPDFIIANANSATGFSGLGRQHAGYLHKLGVDCITAGESIFQKPDLTEKLDTLSYVLRPMNVSSESPGKGMGIFYSNLNKKKLAVISLLGRMGIRKIVADNPFPFLLETIEKIKQETSAVIVDYAALSTAEKQTMGFFLNGKVSAVIGSGNKVPTADETILSEKTAYITDSGRTGSFYSVGGFDPQGKIQEYKTGLFNLTRHSWECPYLQGIVLEVNDDGTAKTIERIIVSGEKHEKTGNSKSN
ncbi:YmdB family metallophosphoesterase [Treponema phagedenis]|uniref:Putative metallophosphoesterase n=1 Tax=Treponema phagedenis TaxID=162 RepID=A0A0B7H2E2_TREPH|nr:TIGR00282 family metallophosphoesterase [Treponema phagedenis]EFW38086.1 putative metallophosphoesterase [Treponema phagedenis F0421]NVP24499.1 YmdB family metallophosphoesterase [Treponema phagedenis]QEJ97741.1 YmdB family metallophosphoesterase [Treponema phagedenis]QEK01371.1 YmdB family metallophosphoesterase [Treponema phagedenis]QEK03308.1 YmdB family metallophosphoesterase [Treponema phagedenis]